VSGGGGDGGGGGGIGLVGTIVGGALLGGVIAAAVAGEPGGHRHQPHKKVPAGLGMPPGQCSSSPPPSSPSRRPARFLPLSLLDHELWGATDAELGDYVTV
jgi:hypothetical protein